MKTTNRVGRLIGVLLIAQMVGGILGNFVLLGPVIAAPGFLVNAAGNSMQVSWSVLIGFATGALSAAIAITAWPVLRQYSTAMALWLLALGIVGLSMAVVENSAVMSLLSLSQAYARTSVPDESLFQALRVVVAATRNWAHYTHLMVGGVAFLVLCGALLRFALIPRALALFGLIAAVLQFSAVTMPLFGYPIVMLMLMPMGLSYLALATWLILKGFQERRPSLVAETRNAGASGAELAR